MDWTQIYSGANNNPEMQQKHWNIEGQQYNPNFIAQVLGGAATALDPTGVGGALGTVGGGLGRAKQNAMAAAKLGKEQKDFRNKYLDALMGVVRDPKNPISGVKLDSKGGLNISADLSHGHDGLSGALAQLSGAGAPTVPAQGFNGWGGEAGTPVPTQVTQANQFATPPSAALAAQALGAPASQVAPPTEPVLGDPYYAASTPKAVAPAPPTIGGALAAPTPPATGPFVEATGATLASPVAQASLLPAAASLSNLGGEPLSYGDLLGLSPADIQGYTKLQGLGNKNMLDSVESLAKYSMAKSKAEKEQEVARAMLGIQRGTLGVKQEGIRTSRMRVGLEAKRLELDAAYKEALVRDKALRRQLDGELNAAKRGKLLSDIKRNEVYMGTLKSQRNLNDARTKKALQDPTVKSPSASMTALPGRLLTTIYGYGKDGAYSAALETAHNQAFETAKSPLRVFSVPYNGKSYPLTVKTKDGKVVYDPKLFAKHIQEMNERFNLRMSKDEMVAMRRAIYSRAVPQSK